jgi:AAA family ATP:ADP antiporter
MLAAFADTRLLRRFVVNDLSARLLNIKRDELPLALLSALLFFCVLCGYFFLRPVREAMGVSRGMDDLRWLFVSSSIVSLVAVLAFGGIVNRFDRRRFIPIAYLFVIVCLVVFASVLIADAWRGGGLVGTDTGTGTGFALAVGYTFFVWLTVVNLFVNSIFWAFMVDLYDLDQGKRMFAFIGVGGTLGAIAGSIITEAVAGMTDSVYLPAGLMLGGAALFGCAILVMLALDRMAAASEHSRLGKGDARVALQATPASQARGRFWDGMTAVASSPYLLGIGLFIMILTVSNTLLYFTQANVVLERADTFSERLASFAQLNMLTQTMALLTQIFITTHLIKRLGVGWTLSLLPLILVAGFAVLAVWPIFAVFAVFQALFRAAEYATTRPARETLFSVIPVTQKYQAKPLIDVFIYRFGDVAGAGIDRALAALGVGLAGVAVAAVPLAAVWAALALALGRAQRRLDRDAAVARDAG